MEIHTPVARPSTRCPRMKARGRRTSQVPAPMPKRLYSVAPAPPSAPARIMVVSVKGMASMFQVR